MADALIGLIGQPFYDAIAELTAFPNGPDIDDVGEPDVESDVGPTFKEQLVKARRGQGVFRSSVLLTRDGVPRDACVRCETLASQSHQALA